MLVLAKNVTIAIFIFGACTSQKSEQTRSSDSQQAATASGICKEPTKVNLWDDTTDTLIKPETVFNESKFADMCSQSTLFVFVGNADSLGKIEFLRSIDPNMQKVITNQFVETQANFFAATKKAANDLAEALKKNDCLKLFDETFETYRRNNLLPPLAKLGVDSYDHYKQDLRHYILDSRILLASIIDGPGGLDSTIETRWYKWKKTGDNAKAPVWGLDNVQTWKWNHNTSKLEKGGGAFELNLPRSLELIVKEMGLMTPKGKFVPVDTIDNNDLDERSGFSQVFYLIKTHGGLFTTDKQRVPNLADRSTPSDAKQVLLFDAHGEQSEEVSSSLYSPFWSKGSACKIYQELGETKLYEAELCAAYESLVASGKINEVSQRVDVTAGIDAGSCSNTAGPGKGLLFDQTITPVPASGHEALNANAALQKPEGIIRMGEALSYSLQGDKLPIGIGRFQIMAANLFSPWPDMILLDSCYGSEKVGDALLESLKGWSRPLVTISNPNPLYVNLLQYRKLSALDYLALPATFYLSEVGDKYIKQNTETADAAGKKNIENYSLIKKMADALATHFTDSGLDPNGNENESSFRKIFPKVLFLNSQRPEDTP